MLPPTASDFHTLRVNLTEGHRLQWFSQAHIDSLWYVMAAGHK